MNRCAVQIRVEKGNNPAQNGQNKGTRSGKTGVYYCKFGCTLVRLCCIQLSIMSLHSVSGRGILAAISDIVGASALVVMGLILGPLGTLRGALYFGNIFWYVWILSPQGLLSRFVRAAIDWRLGNFDSAVFQLEFLVMRLEVAFTRHPKSRQIRIVLEDFYTLLVRSYLHGGHIDDAMLVVIRAKNSLNCDRLPDLARLDAKTAHLVRAGLAAGRLLDGNGLATLYIRSNETPNPTSTTAKKAGPAAKQPGAIAPLGMAKTSSTPARQGAEAGGNPYTSKVIAFPAFKRPQPIQERPSETFFGNPPPPVFAAPPTLLPDAPPSPVIDLET